MNIKGNAELRTLRNALIKGMLDYRADGGASYTKAQVEKCRRLLEEHLDAVSSVRDRNAAKECVKATVLKLNQLNEKAGYELIETDQREDICKYIVRAGALLGFNGEDEDVTEEWRDW
jgi:hypothetical protein